MSYEDDYGHLNCSIMNYYKRFGQNRDLERYLRLQRSYGNCNKSSSEGSLYHPATSTMNENAFAGIGGGIAGCDDNMGRSLQNLSVLKNTSASSSRDKLNSSKYSMDSKKSNEYLSEAEGGSVGADEEKPKTPINEDKSIVSKENFTKSKKGVNINFESFIEINMPNQQPEGDGSIKPPFACHSTIPTPIMPPPPPATIVNMPSVIDSLAALKIVTSSEKMSQTQLDKGSQIESPIVPTTTSKAPVNQSFHEDTQPTYSPTSSIASHHKQKLEWDSGADVGYSKKMETSVDNGLTAVERNALIKLFANYGLNFDSNIILFSSSKSGTKSEENVSTSQHNRKEIQQKWQNICKKLLQEAKQDKKSIAHSTPMVERKSSIKTSEEVKLIDQISRIEKFCQTSNTELKSFGVQVSAERSQSESDAESVKSSPSIDNKSVGKYENEGKSNGHSSSESFNFVLGKDYIKRQGSQKITEKKFKSESSSLDGMTLKSISSSSNFDVSKLNDNPCYKNLSKLEKNLTVGINLMNSLLQSKSLSIESKNGLIQKILAKLDKIIQKNCGESNKILEFYQNQLKDMKSKHPSLENVGAETPNPVIEKSKIRDSKPVSKPSTKSRIIDECPPISEPKINNEPECVPSSKSRKTVSSASSSSRKSEWLEPMTHSELNFELLRQKKQMKEISNETKLQPEQTEESKQLQLSVIEANIKYLEKLKIYLKSGGTKENVNLVAEPQKTVKNETKTSSSLSWNSHSNLKESYSNKKQSNRSKLETPKHVDSNESINTFARHKKEEFIEKYNNRICLDNPGTVKVIYTKPYSKPPITDYFSNPTGNRNTKLSSNNSTSITSSNVFLTSDNASTSLSIAKSSLKSTPTSLKFQENIFNIGTQTSDSLRLTAPIFESKRSTDRKTTRIVNRFGNNKGYQVTPRSIGYTITFNDGRQVVENCGRVTETDEYYYEKPFVGGPRPAPKVGEFISNSNIPSRCSSINDIHNYVFSLQSQLNEKRPDFMARAEERRRYIQAVNENRRYRNMQREQILNANNNQSINTKLNKLPNTRPPATNRLFSTKQIKLQTKRKYSTLPEVVQRKEILKENQIRKNNKRIMDLFNKNLQNQVLKGKVTLSNSLVLV